MSLVDEMIRGYGPKFPTLEDLFLKVPDEAERLRLESPIPGLGRYLKNVIFLHDITSGIAVGTLRFRVAAEYFVSLSEKLRSYQGIFSHQKVIPGLTEEETTGIRNLGKTVEDVFRAEFMEKFTEHDTAAATDYLKILIAQAFERLARNVDGVHFANTSEMVMGNVFGIIGNTLVYGHFIPALLEFCDDVLNYINLYETFRKPLILPDFTHQQAAEPGTLGKKGVTVLYAINSLVRELRDGHGFKRFTGNFGGATGNLTCHYAAYPDIDWQRFAKNYVEGFGLHYDRMQNQSVSYVREAQIFSTIANILEQVIKFTADFVNLASCPSQLFVKEKKKGGKGSSLMPGKSNAWGMEGGISMLEEAISNLHLLAKQLPKYPHQGDMKRSYLFRNIGGYLMPIFIAFSRIRTELKNYHPNQRKIDAFFREYPGMSGSCIQTVLKRMKISGDAYRTIQEIAIKPDGSYANAEEFRRGLDAAMENLSLLEEQRLELDALLEPKNLVAPVHKLVRQEMQLLRRDYRKYWRELSRITPAA